MPELSEKVVLVTGASSGIGEAIARDLAPRGVRLMLVARRLDRLQALADELGDSVACWAADVGKPEDMRSAVSAALALFGRVDVLVNNAGVMPVSPLAAGDTATWRRVMEVNVQGVLNGIAAVLPHMVEQGAGHVINVGSVASLVVTPGNVVYCASKHAVRAISEGLRQEQAGRIRVSQINPGAVESEILEASNSATDSAHMREMLDTWIPAASIAAAVRFCIEQPPEVAVNEITIRPIDQRV